MTLLLTLLLTVVGMAETQKLFTYEQRKEMLDAHNYYRRLAVTEQQASNMLIMEWNAELEGVAYRWVSHCEFKHSPTTFRYYHAGEKYVGENLWGTTRAADQVNVSEAVEWWYNEIDNYDYDTKTCTPGEKCGHYTAVVWYNTYMVGCAMTSKGQCPAGQGGMIGNTQTLLSCNYAPAGNWQKPSIFNKGNPCSNCTEEWSDYCLNGLCSKVANESELNLDGHSRGSSKMFSVPCLLLSLFITWMLRNYRTEMGQTDKRKETI